MNEIVKNIEERNRDILALRWSRCGYCPTCYSTRGRPCVDQRSRTSNNPRYLANPHPGRPMDNGLDQ